MNLGGGKGPDKSSHLAISDADRVFKDGEIEQNSMGTDILQNDVPAGVEVILDTPEETPEEIIDTICASLGSALERTDSEIIIHPKNIQDRDLFKRFLDRIYLFKNKDEEGDKRAKVVPKRVASHVVINEVEEVKEMQDIGMPPFVLVDADWENIEKILYTDPKELGDRGYVIASAIAPVSKERSQYYRTVKIYKKRVGYHEEEDSSEKPLDATEVKYRFEPLNFDFEEEEILPNGQTKMVAKTKQEFLVIDELLGYLWRAGVRFGIIKQEELQKIIKSRKDTGFITIANCLIPEEGKHADIEMVKEGGKKDRAPKALPNGKFNMSQFNVPIPEVTPGESLFKKIPRKLGMPGRGIDGLIIEPKPVMDLDLSEFSGPGTKVVIVKGDECIVAGDTGKYLSILKGGGALHNPEDEERAKNEDEVAGRDLYYAQVSDDLISKTNVNFQNTGDMLDIEATLRLTADISEGRVITGVGFVIEGNVYGKLLQSKMVGEREEEGISIHGAVSGGGTIESLNKDIYIEKGPVSNVRIYAPNGTVWIDAEVQGDVFIYAKRVLIRRRNATDFPSPFPQVPPGKTTQKVDEDAPPSIAEYSLDDAKNGYRTVRSSCIIGEEVEIDKAYSTQIFARKVSVKVLGQRKNGGGSSVFINIPNCTQDVKRAEEIKKNILQKQTKIKELELEEVKLETARQDAKLPLSFEKILEFIKGIKAKQIVAAKERIRFTITKEEGQKLDFINKNQIIQRYLKVSGELDVLDKEVQILTEELVDIQERLNKLTNGIEVVIDKYIRNVQVVRTPLGLKKEDIFGKAKEGKNISFLGNGIGDNDIICSLGEPLPYDPPQKEQSCFWKPSLPEDVIKEET